MTEYELFDQIFFTSVLFTSHGFGGRMILEVKIKLTDSSQPVIPHN